MMTMNKRRIASSLLVMMPLLLLRIMRQSYDGKPTSTTVEKTAKIRRNNSSALEKFLYYNLSCSFEWSKYSCAHQHFQAVNALAAQKWTRNHLDEIAMSFRQLPGGNSRLILIGDSLTRQVFISIGCLLESFHTSAISESKTRWLNDWPCHGTRNCITEGPHSGFNVVSLRLMNGAEIHFLPHSGGAGRGPYGTSIMEPHIVSRMIQELDKYGFVTLGRNTALESTKPQRLTRNDTILINLGTHGTLGQLSGLIQQLNKLGKKLHSTADNNNNINNNDAYSNSHHPLLWYMTTPTQHFQTPTGQYTRKASMNGTCRTRVPKNPRSVIEKEELLLLKARTTSSSNSSNTTSSPTASIDCIFDYDDLNLGNLHVGGQDCSHYCQPGPPDRVATSIYQAWANGS